MYVCKCIHICICTPTSCVESRCEVMDISELTVILSAGQRKNHMLSLMDGLLHG